MLKGVKEGICGKHRSCNANLGLSSSILGHNRAWLLSQASCGLSAPNLLTYQNTLHCTHWIDLHVLRPARLDCATHDLTIHWMHTVGIWSNFAIPNWALQLIFIFVANSFFVPNKLILQLEYFRNKVLYKFWWKLFCRHSFHPSPSSLCLMSTMQMISNYLDKSKTYAFDGKLKLNFVDWKFWRIILPKTIITSSW